MRTAEARPDSRSLVRLLGQAAALGVVVAFLAYLCVELPRDLNQVTPIWLVNAAVLTVLLRTERRDWPLYGLFAVAGNVAAGLHSGGQLPVALSLSLANGVECLISALVLGRFLGRDIDVGRPRDLLWIAGVCGVAAPLASGLVAALVLFLDRSADPLSTLSTWSLANGLGLLLGTPLLLTISRARQLLAERPVRLAGWLALVLLVAATVLVFSNTRYPLLFLLPPILAFVALELEILGAVVGLAIIAVLSMVFTSMGRGPVSLVATELTDRVVLLQIVLLVTAISALPLATINTQRRRLRDVAEEQTRRAGMAATLAGVGYWRLDLASQAMTWSDQMYAIMDVPRDVPLSTSLALNCVHPEDRTAMRARFRKALEAPATVGNNVVRILTRSGEPRFAEGNMTVERNAEGRPVTIFGVVMDVTAQKQAESAIIQSEARYRTLTENGSDLVTHTATDGTLTYISPSVTLRMGYSPEELLGRSFAAKIHPEDVEAVQQAVAVQISSLGRATPVRVAYRAQHKDGRIIWLEARPTVVFDAETGRPTGVTDIIRDITEQKALESDLRRARAEAEDAAAVKAEFLANMSHELRTPLTAVLGFTRLTEDQPELSPTTRSYVARVSNAGKALMATVNDILDFSKLEAGQVDITPVPMAPSDLARETVELFEAQAVDKGLSLHLTGLQGLPSRILADPDRLRQVLLNLIGNAVKFTESGSVEVALAHDLETARLSVTVTDTGPGMPAERVGQLFQRFSQIDGAATRRHGGTGLGLAICKGLVEAMGGEIGVDSREGQGSRFWFSIPAEAVAVRDQPEPSDGQGLSLPEAAHVLIVDDNSANRALVRAILTPFDLRLSEASDGDEAIASARETAFDAILMDLRMPRVDGRTAAASIRREGLNRGTPMLAFSADATHLADDGVFDGEIAKPVSAIGLIAALSEALGEGRKVAELQDS
jgi:PAS domain S-box-containing protein